CVRNARLVQEAGEDFVGPADGRWIAIAKLSAQSNAFAGIRSPVSHRFCTAIATRALAAPARIQNVGVRSRRRALAIARHPATIRMATGTDNRTPPSARICRYSLCAWLNEKSCGGWYTVIARWYDPTPTPAIGKSRIIASVAAQISRRPP